MKTGRRQELRANELSQFLSNAGAFFRKNGSYVVIGLVLIGGVVGSRWYVKDRSEVALNAAYAQLLSLSLTTDDECRESIERLKELASQVQQDEFSLEALSNRAFIASSRLISTTSGEVQMDFVEEARQAYAEIIERFSDRALEYGTALMGQAKLEQTLFVADLDPARRDRCRKYLQQIVEDVRLQLTPLTTLASERLNTLDEVFQPVTLAVRPAPPVLTIPSMILQTESEDGSSAELSEGTADFDLGEGLQGDSTSEQAAGSTEPEAGSAEPETESPAPETESPEPAVESPEPASADPSADESAADDKAPADPPLGDEDGSSDPSTEPQ